MKRKGISPALVLIILAAAAIAAAALASGRTVSPFGLQLANVPPETEIKNVKDLDAATAELDKADLNTDKEVDELENEVPEND